MAPVSYEDAELSDDVCANIQRALSDLHFADFQPSIREELELLEEGARNANAQKIASIYGVLSASVDEKESIEQVLVDGANQPVAIGGLKDVLSYARPVYGYVTGDLEAQSLSANRVFAEL